jgi:EcsC family protein
MVGSDRPDDGAMVPFRSAGDALVGKILDVGVDGAGPWHSALVAAEQARAGSLDVEQAIRRLIATHRRLVGVAGFATGFGGIATMAATVPADIVSFYAVSARMTAAIAYLRGYDLDSDEVRSLILVNLLGAGGATALGEIGIKAGTGAATAALKGLPASVLVRINRRVGFRLVTKFGEKGVINLAKVIPVLGGGIGASVNVASINVLAGYAKRNFPDLNPGNTVPPKGV